MKNPFSRIMYSSFFERVLYDTMIKNIFHNYKEGKLIGDFLSAKIDFVSFLTNNRYFFMNGNEKNSMNFASKYWKKKNL